VQGYAREVATTLSGKIEELGPFELITRGDELPVFAFKVKDEIENFSVFDVSNALRERGWQVPAYTFPKNREDLAALRVVVRRGRGVPRAVARGGQGALPRGALALGREASQRRAVDQVREQRLDRAETVVAVRPWVEPRGGQRERVVARPHGEPVDPGAAPGR